MKRILHAQLTEDQENNPDIFHFEKLNASALPGSQQCFEFIQYQLWNETSIQQNMSSNNDMGTSNEAFVEPTKIHE